MVEKTLNINSPYDIEIHSTKKFIDKGEPFNLIYCLKNGCILAGSIDRKLYVISKDLYKDLKPVETISLSNFATCI